MTTISKDLSSQNLVKSEYELRLKRNARYSLRAFARDLKTSPSRLIEIVNGTSRLSPQRAKAIAPRLYPEQERIDFFVNVAIAENSRSQRAREQALQKVRTFEKLRNHFVPHANKVKFFSDWRNLAIFELAKLTTFDGSVTWLVEHSGLPRSTVEKSLLQMRSLGLANFQSLRSPIQMVGTNFFSEFALPTREIQHFHASLLDKAKENLSSTDLKLFSSAFIPINTENGAKIREELTQFLKNLMAEQDKSSHKDKLYFFGMQFYPINGKSSV